MTTDEQHKLVGDKLLEIDKLKQALEIAEQELEDLWQTDLTEDE